jgi:hypothetical protein
MARFSLKLSGERDPVRAWASLDCLGSTNKPRTSPLIIKSKDVHRVGCGNTRIRRTQDEKEKK